MSLDFPQGKTFILYKIPCLLPDKEPSLVNAADNLEWARMSQQKLFSPLFPTMEIHLLMGYCINTELKATEKCFTSVLSLCC